DEINYRTVKMSFGLPWGGADGFVEVTDFTISDAPQTDMKTCVFIGSGSDPGAAVDSVLIAHLRKTYNVARIVDDDSAMTGAFSIDDLKQYDFAFISESASTWRLSSAPENFYKSAPIPMFYTELFSGQPGVSGWCSAEGFWGTASDSINQVGKVIVVDEANHPLSAGFAFGDEVDIVNGTDDANWGLLTYCMPEVDYIPIAVWMNDPTLSVVFGVEAGTALWDDLGLAIDPTLVSENRVAAVGIYAKANNYITDDGYKLIDTGIKWILGELETAVEKQDNEVPVSFELSQNYPNPFNPSTEIVFNLAKPGYTTLSVYNVLGQLVEMLVDREMAVGTYRFTFDAKNIPSGIYFYQLQSGEFKQMKKMMLMK
ncbi:T9SS type A sorting domain-containing protein, partial [candidate division KSB1 bacterium]|nr:T9SS type A sorting domain-containing protein [candidate division KSB1 bacterium]